MWITDGLYLTYEQALNNANIVFNFFKDKGYTKEAICGLLGNMWRESHVNPRLNEVGGTGYGLTQLKESTMRTSVLCNKSKSCSWSGSFNFQERVVKNGDD